jgi:formylmethanofuran dehydrogenase subunit E-like metal-binding protein
MESKILSKIEKLLKKESLESYVLIVCNKTENQELLVEMAYDGDEILGCYMLENALTILTNKIKEYSEDELEDGALS